MVSGDAIELSAFLQSRRAAILRRWQRTLKRQGRVVGDEFDRELAPFVDELAEALRTRGNDAPAVFGAIAAELGARRARAGVPLRDACRAVAALAPAVISCLRRPLPRDAARLFTACMSEAIARVAEEHTRASGLADARASESAARQALDYVDDAVLIFDRDGQAAFGNRAVERIFGLPPHELAQPELSRLAFDVLRNDHERKQEEQTVRNLRTDEQHQLKLTAAPLGDNAGAVVAAHDQSYERRLCADLEHADRELQTLHARLLRLGHDRSMGDLAAGSALALNNELNALALSMRLLRAEAGIGGEAARHLDAMDAAVKRSAQLVARLQELASRRTPATPRPLDLNQAVMEALDLVRPELTAAATDRSVRIDAHLESVRPVLAPAPELRELLCKLLLAARDELQTGGVVSLRTVDTATGSELHVTHKAGAIDENQQLLLDAVQDLARRWGGELVEEQAPTGQRSLTLRLPAGGTTTATVEPPPPVRATGPVRVLVVDDDAGNRETLSELLALSGHEVDDAATSAEALRAAERRRYGAALVDLAMPEMNGLELARRLRASHPDMRIALVTGWEPPDIAHSGDAVDAVFRKPIDLPAIDAFLHGTPAPRHD
jgi:CheY-like chemotaxis protein